MQKKQCAYSSELATEHLAKATTTNLVTNLETVFLRDVVLERLLLHQVLSHALDHVSDASNLLQMHILQHALLLLIIGLILCTQ